MVTIRTAALDDEAEVLALMQQLFDPPGRKPNDYTDGRASTGFRWAVEREGSDVLIAADAGRIVGVCTIYVDIESIRFGRRAWIEDLVVDSKVRSQGVGAALLDAATEWARERGCSHMELDSGLARVDAHRFYERYGMPKSGFVFGKDVR